MKNLTKLSRTELRKVAGGAESNCHCGGGGKKPSIDIIADNATQCFELCDKYRNS